ncbi:MAG: hypothetical protein JXB45_10980 [Candidatus Krumholzibacteriota bacterium]|nr:hypothetical protein [Candidatus Krumholzibacteriota bacterium]
MKKLLAAGLMFLSLFLAASSGAEKKDTTLDNFDPAKVLHTLQTRLELSEAQRDTLDRILNGYSRERAQIIKRYSGSDDNDQLSKKIEIRRLNRNVEAQVENMLTPEQLDIYHGIKRDQKSVSRKNALAEKTHQEILKIVERLQLSADQEEKVVPILIEAREKRFALMNEAGAGERPGPGMRGLRDRMEEIRKETEQKLKSILTQEQFQEYEKILREERENRRRRGDEGRRGRPGARPF